MTNSQPRVPKPLLIPGEPAFAWQPEDMGGVDVQANPESATTLDASTQASRPTDAPPKPAVPSGSKPIAQKSKKSKVAEAYSGLEPKLAARISSFQGLAEGGSTSRSQIPSQKPSQKPSQPPSRNLNFNELRRKYTPTATPLPPIGPLATTTVPAQPPEALPQTGAGAPAAGSIPPAGSIPTAYRALQPPAQPERPVPHPQPAAPSPGLPVLDLPADYWDGTMPDQSNAFIQQPYPQQPYPQQPYSQQPYSQPTIEPLQPSEFPAGPQELQHHTIYSAAAHPYSSPQEEYAAQQRAHQTAQQLRNRDRLGRRAVPSPDQEAIAPRGLRTYSPSSAHVQSPHSQGAHVQGAQIQGRSPWVQPRSGPEHLRILLQSQQFRSFGRSLRLVLVGIALRLAMKWISAALPTLGPALVIVALLPTLLAVYITFFVPGGNDRTVHRAFLMTLGLFLGGFLGGSR